MTTAPPPGSSRLLYHVARGLVALLAIGCVPTGTPAPAATSPVCLHAGCTPDPYPAPVDCAAAEQGLEFFSPAIVNFDDPGASGQARFMYGYTDGTAFTSANAGYQPAAMAFDRCKGVQGNHIFELSGGPFLGWGGGIGVAMAHLNQDTGLCPGGDACPPQLNDTAGFEISVAALDLSKWEGVSVWARRSPDSQPLLRMLVGTKDTDDDIAFLMYKDDHKVPLYCQRVRECACQFQDAPCNYIPPGDQRLTAAPMYGDGGSFCGSPGATPSYANMAPSSGYSNTCDRTRCNDVYPAYPPDPDPQFVGRPCTPYTTRNGVISNYCYDPATDPPPASGDQQCGDHFTFPMHLTTEWQMFLIPFDTMYQQGWAKKAPYFDLHSVSVVRLTWDSGYIDYWIDDLRFYRHKQP